MVMSSPLAGALMITFWAPASICLRASSALVNRPVDSTTISAPSSFQGRLAGSFSATTLSGVPSTSRPSSSYPTSPWNRPSTESYFSRFARVRGSVRSLTATKSKSAPLCLAARNRLRPIRPNPLIPILAPIASSSDRTLVGAAPPAQGRATTILVPLDVRARASVPVEVAVLDGHGKAVPREVAREVLGHHHGPVAPAGTPDADHQVGLPLRHVARHRDVEQRREPLHEPAVGVLALHVVADLRVRAGQRPKLRHPVGVREEADVEHDVDVAGQTELVAERNDRDLEPGLRRAPGERGADPVA